MSDNDLPGIPGRTVLVAGAGRSGTTWLGKLLDASPRVFYKNEPDNYVACPWFANVPSRLDPTPENAKYRTAFIAALERSFWTHSVYFYRPPDFEKSFLRNSSWHALNVLLRTGRRADVRPSLRIPRWMFRGNRDEIFFVWKSVMSNLRLAWIHEHFPTMPLVLIIRHPGGYLSSWLRGTKEEGWSGFGDKARLDETLLPFPRAEHARYLQGYQSGTDLERELIYWIVANETPLLALHGSPRLKVVVYEELCEDPQRILREVYAHVGLPFCPQAEAFVQASTSEHSDDYRGVFKDPRRVAWKWRQDLASEQLATIDRYLKETTLAKLWR